MRPQIRFFERVKIERRIKQFSRELQSADPASAAHNDLQAKLAQATQDLQVRPNQPSFYLFCMQCHLAHAVSMRYCQ